MAEIRRPKHIKSKENGTQFVCACGAADGYKKGSGERLNVFDERMRLFFDLHRACAPVKKFIAI